MTKACLLLFITLAPSLVFAQSVVINEIAWMGTSVDGVEQKQWWRYEWLELRNASDVAVSFEGWTVELSRQQLDFKIPLQDTIPPKGYFLVGASDKVPNLDLNYANLAGKFINSGQRVVLKNSTGEIVDEVDTTKGWPAGDNKTKQTMERVNNNNNNDTDKWQTSASPGGTPKAQNSSGVRPLQQKTEELGFLVTEQLSSSVSPSATKKDPARPSSKKPISVINGTTLSALAFALGSSAAVVLLRRRLLRV